MSTTEKRLTIAFTRHQLLELTTLVNQMGETPSKVIHRAITMLHDSLKDDFPD
jgi:hypothetical protein